MKALNLKVILGLLIMSFALAACSDDEGGGGSGSGSQLIGNWFGDGCIWALSADNKGLCYEVPADRVDELDGTYYEVYPISYAYDASDNTLSFVFAEDDVDTYKVIQRTDKTMILDWEESGRIYTFIKVPDSSIPTIEI